MPRFIFNHSTTTPFYHIRDISMDIILKNKTKIQTEGGGRKCSLFKKKSQSLKEIPVVDSFWVTCHQSMQKWKREIKQNTDYHFKLQNDTVCTCQPLIVANTGFLHTKYKLVLVITQTKKLASKYKSNYLWFVRHINCFFNFANPVKNKCMGNYITYNATIKAKIQYHSNLKWILSVLLSFLLSHLNP